MDESAPHRHRREPCYILLMSRQRSEYTVALHQPDFLPWSGFFHKMAMSDHWIAAHNFQFQKHGMMRRAAMRSTWVTLPLVGKGKLAPMDTLTVAPGWQSKLVNAIEGRYRSSKYFNARGPQLLDGIKRIRVSQLDLVNMELIHIVREILQISTPVSHVSDCTLSGVDRLIYELSAVGAERYISGNGARAYLGPDQIKKFNEAGIRVTFSNHAPTTSDSIVTLIMDHPDPLEAVLRTHAN